MSIDDFIQREKEVMEKFKDRIYGEIDKLVEDILSTSTLRERPIEYVESKSKYNEKYSVKYVSHIPIGNPDDIESLRKILKNFLHELVDELFSESSGEIL